MLRLNPYDTEELTRIVSRSARLLNVTIDPEGAEEIARRARGTPRIANRLLRRVRDYAEVRASGHVDIHVATAALDLLEVDRYGLDEIDQKIMQCILVKYRGGPVGLNTIAASIDEEPDTIEEVYEPYLMQLGFIDRTPRGRVGTSAAFDYFKISRVPIIGGGGIMSGADAAAKIAAGARLVQFYSGFIYRGPELIGEAVQAIAAQGAGNP